MDLPAGAPRAYAQGVHPRGRAVCLAVCLSLSVGAVAPAHASTITGELIGAKLPAGSAGVASVRAIDSATLEIDDAALVRAARYRLTVPAGGYFLLAATTPFRGKAGVNRLLGAVKLRKGARKTVGLSFKHRKLRRATAAASSFVNVKYPAVWVQHFDVSGPSELSVLRKGLADMLITDLVNTKSECGAVIVEREHLKELIAEQTLSRSPAADPGSGIPAGRIIAHNRVVTGRLSVVGGTATLTVVVTNVTTGSKRSVSRSAPIERFFELEQSVVPETARLICAALPSRFDGTWTRVYRNPSRGSWQVTVTGSATFVRTTTAGADSGQISYALTSSAVSWTASGSKPATSSSGCTTTFSGGGSDSPPAKPPTELSLEDVSGRSEAPKPEAEPFYYSIWVHGDESGSHEYDVTATCPGGSETYKDSVPLPYLQIGFRDWTSNPTEVMKTAQPTLLEGHRTRTGGEGATVEDSWKFEGSE